MDALPVEESTENPVVSENDGVMHACGHDVHMTILCGLIARTARNMPKENILFVFQPGEEGAGGAKKMIESGVFDSYSISSAFALHVTDDHKVGEVASNDNILFAIPKEVNVEFFGRSAHAAFPEKGHDALAASASFLCDLEHQLRKKINPANVFLAHFGKISSGAARNIVSDSSLLEGTLRAFETEIMEFGMEVVKKCAQLAAKKFGCESKVKTLGEYVEVRNSPELFKKLKNICEDEGFKCICKNGELVGEDFGYFTKRFSGIMFWVGSNENDKNPESLHSKTFFPSANSIVSGLEIMWRMLRL
jgi:N-acetyldiaminopimelate deacetylase